MTDFAALSREILAWAGSPEQLTEAQAYRLVLLFSMGNTGRFEPLECDRLAGALVRLANRHPDMGGMTMTAGELKKALADVPDTTPVVYQRIEDVYFARHGWNHASIWLDWDEGTPKSQYVAAASAHKHKTEHGETVFCINAHY